MKSTLKLVREGNLVAVVSVQLLDDAGSWSSTSRASVEMLSHVGTLTPGPSCHGVIRAIAARLSFHGPCQVV